MGTRGFVRIVALGSAIVAGLVHCSPNQPRDVTVESRDERIVGIVDAGKTDAPDGYVYVARRAHGAIGLVGAKHMSNDDAIRFTDRLADELEACAVRQEARGSLAEGAASLVVVAAKDGSASVGDIQLAPGGAVAANALECLVAPARAATFPHVSKAGITALAIEATWSPRRAESLAPTSAPDGSSPDASSVSP